MSKRTASDSGSVAVEKKARTSTDVETKETKATPVGVADLFPSKVRLMRPAPDFTAVEVVNADGTIGEASLSDFAGKWLVLFFYPRDFTFVCPTEIIEFSERAPAFAAVNTAVVGVSCDSSEVHDAWLKTPRNKGGLGQLNIPLIADIKRTMAYDYGVMLDEGHPSRGLFIIDPRGIVRHMQQSDPPVGRNSEEILRIVQGYQYVEKHGEVCPASWRPGSKTIKPNPKDKLQYFATVPESSAAATK